VPAAFKGLRRLRVQVPAAFKGSSACGVQGFKGISVVLSVLCASVVKKVYLRGGRFAWFRVSEFQCFRVSIVS
jgi:hypothetical protein